MSNGPGKEFLHSLLFLFLLEFCLSQKEISIIETAQLLCTNFIVYVDFEANIQEAFEAYGLEYTLRSSHYTKVNDGGKKGIQS